MDFGQYTYSLPPGVDLVNYASQWPAKEPPVSASFPYSAEVSFEFLLPSETLLLLSQGALSAGYLHVTTSSAVSPGSAQVHVIVNYHDDAVRDAVKVGLIKRNDGESGIGIFTPTNWVGYANTDRLYFNVKLTLPQSNPYINNFTTDLHNFAHNIDPLKGVVNIGEIFLKGSHREIIVKSLTALKATFSTSNGAVVADHLVALNATVRSSNGPISGDFYVSDSLDLRTSNGAIKATVGINAGDSNASSTLTMRTSNNVIESIVNLETTSCAGGNFRIKAETSNGPCATQIASLPVDAVLSLDARTSNSPIYVTLPPTYEGDFALSTSNAMADVRRLTPNEPDPAGQGRRRALEIMTGNSSKAAGGVYWSRKNISRGDVTLKSSNGTVTIHI
ncbi:hypothetical protein FB451DRAFT_1397262 [Mycena latifolia]|nr:hypothetical protein FB451DRAFT_1397262 [Mycena latifolia]